MSEHRQKSSVKTFKIPPDRVKKILVRGPNWVGDAMMCVPALDTVRRAFPDSEISLLVRPTVGELFVGHPGVDRVVVYEHAGYARRLGEESSSWPRAFAGNNMIWPCCFKMPLKPHCWACLPAFPCDTGMPRMAGGCCSRIPSLPRMPHVRYIRCTIIWTCSSLLCKRLSPPKPVLHVSPEEQVRAARLLQEGGIQTSDVVIGLNPGSVYGGAKRWLPERFAAVADRLIVELRQQDTRSVRCLIVGSPGEEELGQAVAQRMDANPLVLSGRTSLGELKAIIKRCHLFVTNDDARGQCPRRSRRGDFRAD